MLNLASQFSKKYESYDIRQFVRCMQFISLLNFGHRLNAIQIEPYKLHYVQFVSASANCILGYDLHSTPFARMQFACVSLAAAARGTSGEVSLGVCLGASHGR